MLSSSQRLPENQTVDHCAAAHKNSNNNYFTPRSFIHYPEKRNRHGREIFHFLKSAIQTFPDLYSGFLLVKRTATCGKQVEWLDYGATASLNPADENGNQEESALMQCTTKDNVEHLKNICSDIITSEIKKEGGGRNRNPCTTLTPVRREEISDAESLKKVQFLNLPQYCGMSSIVCSSSTHYLPCSLKVVAGENSFQVNATALRCMDEKHRSGILCHHALVQGKTTIANNKQLWKKLTYKLKSLITSGFADEASIILLLPTQNKHEFATWKFCCVEKNCEVSNGATQCGSVKDKILAELILDFYYTSRNNMGRRDILQLKPCMEAARLFADFFESSDFQHYGFESNDTTKQSNDDSRRNFLDVNEYADNMLSQVKDRLFRNEVFVQELRKSICKSRNDNSGHSGHEGTTSNNTHDNNDINSRNKRSRYK